MEGKKSFVLYTDQREVFDELDDEDAGKLIKHIFSYVNDENPDTQDKLLRIAFAPIKTQLKRDLKSWENKQEQRKEAARKSVESRQRTATDVNERLISLGGNVNGNVNVNGNGNVNGNVISSIDIITYRKFGGKNLVEELMHINDLSEEQILKLHKEWQLTHDESEFETEKHLKNSFILFVKNNAYRFKETKGRTYKKISEAPKENVFAKLLREEIEKENQQKQ
jgi:hypothetical protein